VRRHAGVLEGAAYPASKGACFNLRDFLAAYWGERGLRVNALCPGGVEAGQDAHFRARYAERTPLRRMAAPGTTGARCCSWPATLGVHDRGSLVVDGGFTIW